MPTTTINGFPYPATSDAPNGPLQLQQLAEAVDTRSVPRFASVAARNAAITSPVDGMQAMVNGYPTFYRSGAWRGVVSTSATQATFFNTEQVNDVETGIATLTVNDPGWPYILDVSASVIIFASASTAVNVRVRLDSVTGTIVSQDGTRGPNMPAGEPVMVPLATFPTGTLTGAHSLIVTARRTLGSGSWTTPTLGSLLNATIRPSYA